jgi:phosphohistidine phosphatase
MKTILFIRHAKSSWSSETLRDFDRPLNDRGESDAPKVGAELLGKIAHIDHVYSSSSKRTTQTTKLLFSKTFPVSFHDELYHPSVKNVLDFIHRLDDKKNTIAIISHNPTTTDICNHLQSDVQFTNIPTCGVVCIQFDVENWQDVEHGKLNFYIFPNKDKNYLIL